MRVERNSISRARAFIALALALACLLPFSASAQKLFTEDSDLNPKLVDAIDATGLFYFNGDVVRMSSAEQMAQGNADHAMILEALAARDAAAAERHMRAHIERTTRIIRSR